MNSTEANQFADDKKKPIDASDSSMAAMSVGHNGGSHGAHKRSPKKTPPPAVSHPIVRFFKTHFELQQDISLGHTITFCFAVMFTICAFVFVNAQQAYILADRFKIPKKDKGSITGTLVVADEALAILLIAVWGFLSDLIGRRILYAVGFFVTALGLAIVPHATCIFGPSFFSSLLFFRLIFSLGCSIIASLMVAILSDTATNTSRGRFSALVGLCSGLGAVLGALFFPRLPVWFKQPSGSLAFYQCSYYALSLCICLLAVFVLIFISNGPKASHVLHRPSFANAKKQIIDALSATRNPMISLAYFSGFTARSITSINTVYYTLWVTESFRQLGLCPQPITQPCMAAYGHGHMLHGILQITSLVFAPVYGYLAHRVSGRLAIIVSCACCAIAYVIMIAVQSANNKWQYLVSILAGAGQIGIVIAGLSLVVAHSPVHLRGAISGAYSFFGALSILINSKIAGALFDAWTPIAPFLLLFFWTLLLLGATLAVSVYYFRRAKQHAAQKGQMLHSFSPAPVAQSPDHDGSA